VSPYVLFLVVGLGAGAAYAAVAMGLVTAYRGSGVINIAQGAMAMWPAYVFDELRRRGDLVLPVGRIHLGGPVGTWPALIVGVVTAAVLGLLVHVLVFRPLRRAPALARVVASVGLAIALQALVGLRFGPDQREAPHVLPSGVVHLLGMRFSADRIWLSVVALAVAALLWAFGRWTRTGLATAAAAEDEQVAQVLGYSPERLGALTWVLASTVGGLVAILVASTLGLDPITWTLLVVPALACALVGRLGSVWVACAAGLGLGAVQSEITLLSTRSWWPHWASVGVAQSAPFIVIVIALFVLGPKLPTRASAQAPRLPPVTIPRRRAVPLALLLVGGSAAVVLTHGSYRFGVVTSLIMALLALSLVMLTGMVGQISLAQAAFAGSAGFAVSKVGTGLPFPVSALVAALVATGLGLVVGIPALRIRGAQLAVVTLAAGVAIQQFVFENPNLAGKHGDLIPAPSLFGLDLAVRRGAQLARWQFGMLVVLVVALCAVGATNLMRSATGRALLAVRSNERAAAAVGVDVAMAKLVAFAASSFLAGLAGALIGYSRGQLSADSFSVAVSMSLMAFAYLGGITGVGGALIAGALAPLGIVYVVLDRAVRLGRYYLLISGLVLIATAIANPGGIAAQLNTVRARLSRGTPRAAVPR